MRFSLLPLLFSFALLLGPSAGYAQDPDPEDEDDRLGDFEDAADDSKHDGKKKHNHTDDDDDDDGVGEFLFEMGEVAVYSVIGSGGASWVRVHGSSDPEWTSMASPRMTGEPVIPFFRLDAFYQDVESDVRAVDVSGELGYGPLAFQYRHTHYTQDRPDNDLDLGQALGLYRMSFSQYVEVDLGFGAMTLDGVNRRSGFEFTVPLTIQPSPYVGARFHPAWGYLSHNTIKDFTLLLTGSLRFASLEAGYRWVSVGGVSLDGPVIGAAFHF